MTLLNRRVLSIPVTTWRQQQAAETRRQIVRAARRLFAVSGYTGTTIEAIAAEAGVAVATVYKAFGSKAAITRALNDVIDEEGGVEAYAARIAGASDPAEILALTVAQNRALYEHCGDIIAAVRSGAAVEPALAAVYAEGDRRHDDGMRWVIGKIAAARALRVDVPQAVGLMSLLCSVTAIAEATERLGWTADQYQEWTLRALRELLISTGDDGN
jgi:AcrR family transcriptional regulator